MLKEESEIFKRKEEFRLRHRKASNAKEDVMRRYYGIERNLNAPVRIDAPTLERVIGKYGGNGMICIRTENAVPDEAANEANTRRLISALKHCGYRYLPLYAIRHKPGSSEDDFVPSFLLFNHNQEGNPADFQLFLNMATQMCDQAGADYSAFPPEHHPTLEAIACSLFHSSHPDCYVNPMPCQLSERMRRSGEVMVWE